MLEVCIKLAAIRIGPNRRSSSLFQNGW